MVIDSEGKITLSYLIDFFLTKFPGGRLGNCKSYLCTKISALKLSLGLSHSLVSACLSLFPSLQVFGPSQLSVFPWNFDVQALSPYILKAK